MKYMLVDDNDGDWYVIPTTRFDKWYSYITTIAKDGEPPPKWADQIDSPTCITFSNWDENDV